MIDFVTLANFGSINNQTSYSTGSYSPVADLPLLAFVYSNDDGNPAQVPTLSGNGLTWTQVVTKQHSNLSLPGNPRPRLTVFRAIGASPSIGALTADFAGNQQNDCKIIVVQCYGFVKTGSNAADLVIDTASNEGTGVTGLTVTLPTFAKVKNVAIGVITHFGSSVTTGSGFNLIAQNADGAHILQIQYKINDTTVDWTFSTENPTAVALELNTKVKGIPMDMI